ncbi:MAG: ribonuclease P protein component [Rhodobacterales bacterium]|nr:MAG: ribonuclease P protein component [Rhodobacterales bacterium]
MTPPEAPDTKTGNMPPAVSVCPEFDIRVMTARSQFLAAARARRQGTKAMMVQMRARKDGDPTVHIGFTCSKKVGNAVARNRAKRRLREVARLVLPTHARPGHDYVLIGRANATADRPFKELQGDLIYALKKLHNSPTDHK